MSWIVALAVYYVKHFFVFVYKCIFVYDVKAYSFRLL